MMTTSSTLDASTIATAVGPLTLIADPDGALRAAGFTADPDDLLAVVHPDLRGPVRHRADLGDVTRAVRSYLAGELTAIDQLPVSQRGGPFQRTAWSALREVKPGEPVSYTAFALRSGRPAAVRAAAGACARNAVALVVPCHRVLRGDGTLGGYRWGLPIKKWLLDHESQVTFAGQ
ncbi:methylated-DNA--[protein]-cysteine S-methyltransferase [Solwaraspora sp. WMMA2059]|uniref:methylated-DNA--[protein]-cysteine S-methyltransferase n=1 Tax=Solwaraspora sp. WMMA2059 TaxID=3015160 RepID=UPI00248CEBAE|nr:methylated-DNA--[protein]-cysteine S-methyltransferase [Solwaraspora sp. WMMA2059]WBB97937.1 methylated-DNA--[protein]-cysteine S-methyltransferase [Solwaraspora sp. WMMA2059]